MKMVDLEDGIIRLELRLEGLVALRLYSTLD
jgi:hypothetical protein